MGSCNTIREATAFILSVKMVTCKNEPVCKYTRWSGLSLFLRFYESCFQRSIKAPKECYKVYCLICLWIASKMHEKDSIEMAHLKNLAHTNSPDQLFTADDFSSKELEILTITDFNLKTRSFCPFLVERMFGLLQETAQSGKALELNMCITLCEIVLLSDSKAFQRPQLLIAGSVIATAYILSVPSSEINFPILLWVSSITGFSSLDVKNAVKYILTVALMDKN